VADLAQMLLEELLVFLEMQRFAITRESSGGLHKHKLIDNRAQFFKSQAKHIELVEKQEAVVDHQVSPTCNNIVKVISEFSSVSTSASA
jgi:hypothetical protein